ncbi:MAG TPA: 50S ribosomal protein L1 [Candidatus Omnitrophota bacterium]|nr:50S ribosomal protein L1 [Candidatus Omnitrophota bacterium]
MANETKRKKAILGLVDKKKLYTLDEAISILKKGPKTRFDQTVQISVELDLDQASNPIRGTVSLPHGTGKKVRVAAFCKGDHEKEAKEAGADVTGADELIKKVSEGWCDFDVAVATPDMMKDMARLGKVLGPRGLMPNPKAGTVSNDIAKAVKDVKAGKIEFKMDKQSGIKASVGKLSFENSALIDNMTALVKAIVQSNPKLQRVQYIRSVSVSSTMGPGVKLEIGQFKIS